MLGFVSALSSSVAVMVLLMSVLLANVLSTTMGMEKNKDKTFLEGISDKQNIENNKNIENNQNNIMKSLVFNHADLKVMNNPKIKVISVHCSYGNNLSFDSSMTYTVYNTVLIKKNIPNITVVAEKPVKDTQGENTCFLKSTKHERK